MNEDFSLRNPEHFQQFLDVEEYVKSKVCMIVEMMGPYQDDYPQVRALLHAAGELGYKVFQYVDRIVLKGDTLEVTVKVNGQTSWEEEEPESLDIDGRPFEHWGFGYKRRTHTRTARWAEGLVFSFPFSWLTTTKDVWEKSLKTAREKRDLNRKRNKLLEEAGKNQTALSEIEKRLTELHGES